jgi:hypothetical protein
MKILFFPIYITTPHYETELELMLSHLMKGDEVFLVRCTGYLKTCFNNFLSKKSQCDLCRSILKTGLDAIGFPEKNIIKLPIKNKDIEPVPATFKDIQELINFNYDGMSLGRVSAANLTFYLNYDHKLNTVRYKNVVSKVLHNTITIYSGMLQILKKIAPDLVYIFNGRFAQSGAVRFACEKMGIHYITHERGGALDRYYLRRDALAHEIKITAKEIKDTWDNSTEDKVPIGEQWFIERRGGAGHGWYSYIKNQIDEALPKNFDETKTNIGIFNGNIEETFTIEGLRNPIYPTEDEAIEDVAREFQPEQGIHLYLRTHPHLSGKNNSQTRDLKRIAESFTNLTVIPPESSIHSYTLLDHCDRILVFGSTIGVEACYWNKPVILNGRSFYEDLDCAYIPRTREELMELIRSDLPPKDREGALKYGYWEKRKGIPYRFYKAINVTRGTFLGRTIKATRLAILKSNFRFVFFEIENLEDIKYRIVAGLKKVKDLVHGVKFSSNPLFMVQNSSGGMGKLKFN